MEALVSVVVLAVVVVVAVTAFQGGQKLSRSATIQGDSQQSARVGVDLMTGDLRTLGYGLGLAGGQRGLVYAGPWDIIFNANVGPAPDSFLNPGFPRAINPALAPAVVGGGLYAPSTAFATGAETVRFTLDSSGDGNIDATDIGDDPEEATVNPRDFVLRKEVYGELANGTNGGTGEAVAVVAGPVADNLGLVPTPLFTYWLDDDDDVTTPEILHGDGDADGLLSQAEIMAVGPVTTNQLALVTRVVVTVTAEDGEPIKAGEYRTRELVSSVTFRNEIRRTGIVAGTVFQDSDGDGVYNLSNETPIAGVTIRLDTGVAAVTDAAGRYTFRVSPGSYTVTEFDLPGYVSTTPNTYSTTVGTGALAQVDFGDRPGSGIGTIQGTVYNDLNKSMAQDSGELGISGVVVTLHTGQADTTDGMGFYSFTVPVASYTVVETDSSGWTSTTPNAVAVTLSIDGQVIVVNFGDLYAGALGTLAGTVFNDTDYDGLFDPTEAGIPDVSIKLVQGAVIDSAVTDGAGAYSVNVSPGMYAVVEQDPAGYTSTTPNVVLNAMVQQDSTTTVDFGDVLNSTLNFTIVTVGTTNRALSIASYDMQEDSKGDPDIILGTEAGAGFSNLHVWRNNRANSGTALAALFPSTPTFSRNAGAPIPVVREVDLNGDGTPDVVTGLDATTSNIKMWVTITSGAARGTFPTSANATNSTNTGSTVLSVAVADWPGYTANALLVGTDDGSGAGHVEVWEESGAPSYSHLNGSDLFADSKGALGVVTAIAVADFDGNGRADLAIAQDNGSYQGRVAIMLAKNGGAPWTWLADDVLYTDGTPLALTALDMKEDNGNDVDLLIGTSRGTSAGTIELFLNDGTGKFGMLDAASGLQVRDDWIDAGGEVLALGTELLDRDVFPDVIVGLRTMPYSGKLNVYKGTGFLPSSGSTWSYMSSGEVVTLTLDDYNIDGLWDVAVGTRTAATTGALVVYFGQ